MRQETQTQQQTQRRIRKHAFFCFIVVVHPSFGAFAFATKETTIKTNKNMQQETQTQQQTQRRIRTHVFFVLLLLCIQVSGRLNLRPRKQ